MDHYIGIDVACKTSFVCAVDEKGKQVCLKSIPTNVQAIIKCLNHNKLNATCIGIETGTECHHLAAGLKEFGYNVEIIDARKSAPILEAMNVNKNDPNDALGLANLLRAQMHSKVNLKSFEQLDQLALVNSRRILVDQRTAIGNQIRGLAKVHGIKVIGQFNPNNWKPVISSHPDASQLFRKTIKVQLEMYEQLTKGIESYDQILNDIVDQDSAVKCLMTAPGVGPVLAVTFKAHFDGFEFSRSRNVGSYLGMSPREFSSGNSVKRGSISKRGPEYPRKLLMSAGMSIICHSKKESSLRTWGLNKKKTMSMRSASVAVGRKLGTILYRMLQTGTEFKFEARKKEEPDGSSLTREKDRIITGGGT